MVRSMFLIVSTLLFLYLNKMLVFRAEIYFMLVRIANKKDPDQTASSEDWSGSALFVKVFLKATSVWNYEFTISANNSTSLFFRIQIV